MSEAACIQLMQYAFQSLKCIAPLLWIYFCQIFFLHSCLKRKIIYVILNLRPVYTDTNAHDTLYIRLFWVNSEYKLLYLKCGICWK